VNWKDNHGTEKTHENDGDAIIPEALMMPILVRNWKARTVVGIHTHFYKKTVISLKMMLQGGGQTQGHDGLKCRHKIGEVNSRM
jgi:hypothetical protein